MISLHTLSIIIPFQYDTDDRIENLNTVLRYFHTWFKDTEIMVLETGPSQHFRPEEAPTVAHYQFFPSEEPMHRTQLLNIGASLSDRQIVVSYDTDVLVSPEALKTAISMFHDDPDLAMVFPYNGVFLDIDGETKALLAATFNFSAVPIPAHPKVGVVAGDVKCVHTRALGGLVMFRRTIFQAFGGYNRRFISWGWEDNEIMTRFAKLGYLAKRVTDYPCLHLHHRRGPDSHSGHAFFKQNYAEFKKVKQMTRTRLLSYITAKLGGHDPSALAKPVSLYEKMRLFFLAPEQLV